MAIRVSHAPLPHWRARPIVAGALAGVVGGVVFGMMMSMAMPATLGMIGSLLGAPSLGWGVHLLFSAIIGAGFGVVAGERAHRPSPAAAWGLAYGVVWWVLGPLLIMPIWLGMGPMLAAAFDASNLMSLMGHMVFGVVTGLAYWALHR